MEKETSEFAQAADLLAPVSGTKEVKLKTLKGKSIRIKKVSIGELSDILKASKGSDLDQFIWLTYKCLVAPKLTVDQVKKLPYQVLLEISSEVSRFSGLDEKSTKAILNLLKTES